MLFVFKDLVNSIGSGFVMIMLVSSAKSTGFAEVAMVFGRSFMYNMNNSGPRMEPWGTPYLMGSHSEKFKHSDSCTRTLSRTIFEGEIRPRKEFILSP